MDDYNFDPLGLAEKSPEMIPWYRECEIKHGRIAMLAVVGFITAEYVRIPGDMYQVLERLRTPYLFPPSPPRFPHPRHPSPSPSP